MAVKLAADHPDIVGRLVLVAIPADEDQIDLPTALWLATLPVVGPIFYTLGRALGALRKMWMRPFVADPADLTEEVVEDAGRSTPAAASQTLSISRREIARGRLARQARIIKTPMLLIAGEDDQIVDPQAVGVWGGSVDQAEVCLLDNCGHLPMIERTTEFNAQVLAFLTGDARYLEYVETPPASEDDIGYAEVDETEPFAQDGEARRGQAPVESPGETVDSVLPDQVPDDLDVEPREDRLDEDRPNVFRKRGGSYSKEDGGEEDAESPRGDGRWGDERPRRSPRDSDFIPQLPEDLFDWPEPRDEYRPRERPKAGNPEEGEPDEPEEPSRS
jgi:hypothetical protein